MRDITAFLDVNAFIVRLPLLAPWCRKTAVAILALCAWKAAHAESMAWALAYEGKDKQGFLYDPRVVHLILRDLGIASSSRQMLAFHGVPAPVNVVARRYVWSSSCEAHQCPFNRGFFWLDSESGESLAARVVMFPLTDRTVLTIGGSASSANAIPPEAMTAMRGWILENNLRFTAVYYQGAAPTGSSRPRATRVPYRSSLLRMGPNAV